jgi:hypothetical protein
MSQGAKLAGNPNEGGQREDKSLSKRKSAYSRVVFADASKSGIGFLLGFDSIKEVWYTFSAVKEL